ncbi:MAG: nucleotidyltransferase family protein [Maricaulaceae bacterium]
MRDVNVLILAGQREGVVDPLCAEAGIERKALLPLLGRPMIDYVLEALSASKLAPKFYVSGFDADYDARLLQSPSAPGPAGSALVAIEAGIDAPLLVTTCDHPLLTPGMVEIFLSGARESGADFCVGLAERDIIDPAYPGVSRTYLKFSDKAVSGCNLFYIANAKGIEAIRFWRQAQHDRKKPWKLASRFGVRILFDYLLGRLTLGGAFEYASKRLGITAKPVLIPIAEAAIDVDKPSDKRFVEQILSARAAKSA